MADAKQAIDFVMRQEDSALSGAITDNPNDRGGCTRFGLTERWHPELAAQGFFSDSMSAADALALAESAYAESYDAPLQLAAISSQAVATALLSFAVLEGTPEAAPLFQKAINAVGGSSLAVDGLIGAETVEQANAADAAKLRDTFVALCENYFTHVAQVMPGQSANLRGWMNRANALLALPVSS